MFEFHTDKKRYFEMQQENAEEYVIPFIAEKMNLSSGIRVLEIGCGEGGVLKAFIDKGLDSIKRLILQCFPILRLLPLRFH